MIFSVGSRVLVLAPHTDDAELGCGGTIARLVKEFSATVQILNFSAAEESVPEGMDPSVNRTDCKAAALELGVVDARCLDFPVREFPQYRQRVLQTIYDTNKDFKPDLVLCPASMDHHQDHGVVHQEACRAFGAKTILGYEIPWNTRSFRADLSISLPPEFAAAKVRSLALYRSQAGRRYMGRETVEATLRHRGVQSGFEFAEAFEVVRMVVK
jgi:N-acetylglucosamine malate deacetylase 1